MPIATDLTDALAVAGPVPTGFRRRIVVGVSAGAALATIGWNGVADGRSWLEKLPESFRGFSVLPTDQFPGWSIVDRPRSALGVDYVRNA